MLVGGGLGRTPIIGQVIREFLEKRHLLSYLESILRVYNQLVAAITSYKARIKILVKTLGIDNFRAMVEEDWSLCRNPNLALEQAEIDREEWFFAPPAYASEAASDTHFAGYLAADNAFATWVRRNVTGHQRAGYRNVFVSLKAPLVPPGI